MRHFRTFAIILTAGFISGCAPSVVVEDIAIGEMREIALGETAKPLQFRAIVVRMPRNKVIGMLQLNALCFDDSEITYRGGRIAIDDDRYSDTFREILENANYTVVGDPDSLFEDEDEWKAELLIAGLIKDIKANICFPHTFLNSPQDSKGEAQIEVEWQVYSRLDREVVYRVTTRGSGEISDARFGGGEDSIIEAFAAATQNLLADEDFYNLIRGNAVDAVAQSSGREAFEPLTISATRLSTTGFQDQVTNLRSKVATIYAGGGTGSGFFVDENYILTNQHVVGGARFVVVRLVTGRELVGEVVRIDRRRDVAVVRTESIGQSGLPLRTIMPGVGSRVFVIGSPLGDDNESTVSSGIVSAIRTEDGQDFIQSDATILPGNSGGPMFDENGNVIAISVSGLQMSNVPVGVNFFIPVGEAIRVLNLELDATVAMN